MAQLPNITPEQQKQAMWMGLLSAGAGMLDPRGTYGSTGASINRGLQQGLGTYIPMAQWMQKSNLQKEDRDYRKERDEVMDRFRQTRQDLMQTEIDQRSQANKLRERQVDIQESQFQMERDAYERQQELIKQFMPNQTVADVKRTGQYPGIRSKEDAFVQGAVPGQFGGIPNEMMPGPQPQPQSQPVPAPSPAQPQSMFGAPAGMTPFQMMMLGDYGNMPALSAVGQWQMDRAAKQADLAAKGPKYTIRQDPFGMSTQVYQENPGTAPRPIMQYNAQGQGKPITQPGSVIDYQDYFE